MYQIPIRITIFGTLKFLVTILIQCPNNIGCLGSGLIVRQGRDLSHSKRPYRYRCQECGKPFYAHTSRQFKELNNQQQELIMKLSTVFIKKSMTTNRVEGKYGNFDLSVAVSGRKNFVSYQNMVDSWLQEDISFDDFSKSSIYAVRNLNKAVQISIIN